MKKLNFFAAALLAVFLEVTLLNYLKIFSQKPNLFLLLLTFAALNFNFRWLSCAAIFLGALQDTLAILPFAPNIFLFPLWGFFLVRVSKGISLDNNYRYASVVFAIVLIHNLTLRLIFFFTTRLSIGAGIFFGKTFLEGLYTVALTPVVFKMLKKIT